VPVPVLCCPFSRQTHRQHRRVQSLYQLAEATCLYAVAFGNSSGHRHLFFPQPEVKISHNKLRALYVQYPTGRQADFRTHWEMRSDRNAVFAVHWIAGQGEQAYAPHPRAVLDEHDAQARVLARTDHPPAHRTQVGRTTRLRVVLVRGREHLKTAEALSSMSALIELTSLTKDYGNFRALDDVNLTVQPGITGLLGPNGAGKSTLIKVLLGLVGINQGSGHVLGFPLGTSIAQIRTQIGYMPEDDCYIHGLSGIDSIQVAARLSRIPATEALRRGHEILDFCGAGQERYRLVETYSTGMRQKLRFAMAIVHDPKLLILDEPTSGLDPEEREAMLNRIRVLARDFHKSVILCTHILPDVQTVCQYVVILAAGSVRVSDSLETLCRVRDPSVTVSVTGDAQRLQTLLQSRGVRAEAAAPFQLRVPGEAGQLNAVLWSAAEETNCVIRGLTPSRNSLEQIFLDAVREVHRADS